MTAVSTVRRANPNSIGGGSVVDTWGSAGCLDLNFLTSPANPKSFSPSSPVMHASSFSLESALCTFLWRHQQEKNYLCGEHLTAKRRPESWCHGCCEDPTQLTNLYATLATSRRDGGQPEGGGETQVKNLLHMKRIKCAKLLNPGVLMGLKVGLPAAHYYVWGLGSWHSSPNKKPGITRWRSGSPRRSRIYCTPGGRWQRPGDQAASKGGKRGPDQPQKLNAEWVTAWSMEGGGHNHGGQGGGKNRGLRDGGGRRRPY